MKLHAIRERDDALAAAANAEAERARAVEAAQKVLDAVILEADLAPTPPLPLLCAHP